MGRRPAAYSKAKLLIGAPVAVEKRAPLWRVAGAEEFPLTAGKVENLRIACRAFHGLEIPPGGVVSFWRQLGRTTRRKGYLSGRELREGCIVPAIGGGLCQLSGLLYQAALGAGLEIVERHGHSRVVPGSGCHGFLELRRSALPLPPAMAHRGGTHRNRTGGPHPGAFGFAAKGDPCSSGLSYATPAAVRRLPDLRHHRVFPSPGRSEGKRSVAWALGVSVGCAVASRGQVSDLASASALVLPAWIEHQPRLALLALASGIPVIATEACGLPLHQMLKMIPVPDAAVIAAAIRSLLHPARSAGAA